jgi:hypothetical protein
MRGKLQNLAMLGAFIGLTAFMIQEVDARGGRGGGGGGRGNNESLTGKVGQAKNGFMSGMVVGEQTLRAYTEVKAQAPKAITDLNAAITKATALSATLARYNLTLTVPQPVKAIDAAPVRKATGAPKQ